MDDKGRMDDLASLFLPDLLHPLSNTHTSAGEKAADVSFLVQDRSSNISTPLSSGLGMFMTFAEDRDQNGQGVSSANNFQYGPNGQIVNYPQNHYNSANFPNGSINYHSNFQSHRYLPFPDQDFSHTLHYAEFIPAEAGLQQPLRHHQRRQMLPVQPAFSPSTVIGQFDGISWQGTDEFGLLLYSGSTPEFAIPGQRPIKNEQFIKKDIGFNGLKKEKAKAKKVQPEKGTKGATPQINVDYSPKTLSRLLVLVPNLVPVEVLTDSTGQIVATKFLAILDGRLLTNDQDNYNHICAHSGTPKADEVYLPRVISCYRRNFVSVHLKFTLDNFSGLLFFHGKPVNRFRIDIGAITEGKDQTPVPFMIINEKDKSTKEKDKKDSNRSKLEPVSLVEKSNPIELQDCRLENSFWIKKLQFKSATSNNSNLNYQTYYRLTAQLVAETDSDASVLHDLIGVCMTVRGRNPSFYQERRDIRIKSSSTEGYIGNELEDNLKQMLEPVSQSLVDSTPKYIKEEDNDETNTLKVGPNFDSGNGMVKNGTVEEYDDDGENTSSSQSDSRVLSQPVQVPPSQPVSSVDDFIASKTKDVEKNYHYFPILSVYYLPPINVVYFPHGAHQDTVADKTTTAREGDSKESTPGTSASVEKKRGSKVYFR